MSKDVQKFLKELAKNETLKTEFGKLDPATPEKLVLLAETVNCRFTKEELMAELAENGIQELTEEDLGRISGGAFPTAVNNQITDSVT